MNHMQQPKKKKKQQKTFSKCLGKTRWDGKSPGRKQNTTDTKKNMQLE